MGAVGGMRKHEGRPSKTTLFLASWAFCTIFWSIFTPPQKTWAARILIFQPLWALRILGQDGTWTQDLGLFLCLHAAFNYFSGVWTSSSLAALTSVDIHSESFRIYAGLFGLLGACGALAGGIVRRGRQLKPEVRNDHLCSQRIDEQLLPPLLIPSRTSHSRMFPKIHSFEYSYLYVGIPVGVSGQLSTALSVDGDSRSWFHVDSADYLARGQSELGLGQKLKEYLHTHGVTDRDYAFAYLVTAPKFLGYSFNPASFWYIYDSDTSLKYIIIEVNNTFDERRMYLLKADSTPMEDSEVDETEKSTSRRTSVFTNTWQKDFHVSPFNSVKGSYSLKAVDPLAAYQDTGSVLIDSTIVLRSSKNAPKIVARVWSEGGPHDATSISYLSMLRFVAAWCWVGFATFPRIAWEANKLFFRKKLHVWYRPEVVETSLGRSSTADETDLERYFRAFLEDVVSHADKALRVIYEPADAGGEEVVMYSPGFTYEEDHQRTLAIKVTSPAFYSRMVHYAHIKEAFDRECFATEEKNRTLTTRSPHLLPIFLEATTAQRTIWTSNSGGIRERLRWSWLRGLRCPPPPQSYGQADDSASEYTVSDIRTFQDSELDRFVRHQGEHVAIYQRILLKLFLAQRFAFGVPALITGADLLLRTLMLLATMCYASHATAIDVFRSEHCGREDIGRSVLLLLLANSVHLWSYCKG